MNNNRFRYPGIRPFHTDESDRFFGRDNDIERLWRLIRLEQVVILYGRSGFGKSSLLAAGIYPKLAADQRYRFWEVRFGPYRPEAPRPPADTLLGQMTQGSADAPGPFPAADFGAGLWQALKNRQGEHKKFILFFDQFEELFSYPPAQILAFKQQLAEALYTAVPEAVAEAALSPAQEKALNEPFELKVVFSIRADRMSQLKTLEDYLPNLLRHGYPLDALDEQQARAAIVEPAALIPLPGEPDFATPRFTYTPEALDAILLALRDESSGRYAASALQIVCRHVERHILPGLPAGPSPATVTAGDLGELSSIFRNFYDSTLRDLSPEDCAAACRLCEDVLIKDGARVPYAAQALLGVPGVHQGLLDRLAAASLLRVERDEQGRMLYEVGHDTLVGPIQEAAKARREQEEKERLQREAEDQRRQKEKAQAATRRAWLITLGAIALAAWALYQTWAATQSENRAEKARREALVLADSAQAAQGRAEASQLRAGEAEKAARDSADYARTQAAEAIKAQAIAAEALRRATDNAAVAVRVLLSQARQQVVDLDYAAAAVTLHAAARLEQDRPAVARGLLEIAFFQAETGGLYEARARAAAAARLLGSAAAAEQIAGARLADGPAARNTLLAAIQALAPDYYRDSLLTRYYPVMLPVQGGAFVPGCIKPGETGDECDSAYVVTLSDYRLARTETTVWQYNIYCAARGLGIAQRIGPEGDTLNDFAPSWGWKGNHPVVYVNWYDAAEYANWLSERMGLARAYEIRKDEEDKTNERSSDQYKWTVRPLPGPGFRLPTEAEWEWAARGGIRRDTFRYAGSDTLDLVGWYDGNSKSHSWPFAAQRANGLGIFDLSGNVWEWCGDWKGAYPSGPRINPVGAPSGAGRVLRGGSWLSINVNCQVSVRVNYDPNIRDFYGFRLSQGY
ncbi:MAG: SUMF1/EgtB/PvdO family nonheme iron enzyme [Saprospiraceae bacterium]